MSRRTAGRHTGSRGIIRVAGVVVLLAAASPAQAHLTTPDLAFYGPFTAGSVHCLRRISQATQRCFKRVLSLQRRCASDIATTGVCDRARRDAAVSAAEQAAQAVVAASCTGGQLTELSYSSLQEAQTDVLNACSYQATATLSMAYAPVTSTGEPAGMASPAAAACMATTAAASQRLLSAGMRWRSRAFNRMAVRLIVPSKKRATMAAIDAEFAAAAGVLGTPVADRCPTFETLYGQDPATLLSRLRTRSDCIISGAYVQNAVLCPLPVCGNGAREVLEQCDDGNTTSGDGCSGSCQVEGSSP